MAGTIARAANLSALISAVIFALLKLGELVFPAAYPTPVEWWMLVFLFAVAFVPRLIMILVDAILARNKARRRQRRRKT